jgi:RNA polymerase sigma-70 factor (ECF subfamily)
LDARAHDAKRDRLLGLLAEHEAALGRYAARIVQDGARAKDLVQETFLKLWQADDASVGTNPAAWLYTVCRNLCFDHLRKERRMIPHAPDELPPALRTEPEGETADGMSPVLQALSRLPANQQEVIRLKFQGGLSYKDISRVTGHSVSHVGVLIHNGVKALRAAAKEGGAR